MHLLNANWAYRSTRHAIGALLLLLLLLILPERAGADPTDPRQVYQHGSAHWLNAIGQLKVPSSRLENGRRKHFYEDCSATLIRENSANAANASNTDAHHVLTAWHCLEHYHDLSRAIVFTLPHRKGEAIKRSATIIADGGSMAADWALLRLTSSISSEDAQPLSLNMDDSYHTEGNASKNSASQTAPANMPARMKVTMAGFSRDNGLGQKGTALTYDAQCNIQRLYNGIGETDCTAFKGASGGPVLQRNSEGQMVINGVISQGDGAGYSTYVTTDSFSASVVPLLAH
ncbi:MAG: serine protease [Halioglobus sp.]